MSWSAKTVFSLGIFIGLCSQSANANTCARAAAKLSHYALPLLVASIDFGVNMLKKSDIPRKDRLRMIARRNAGPLGFGALIYFLALSTSNQTTDERFTSVRNDFLPLLVEGPHALKPSDSILFVSADYHDLFERDRDWILEQRPDLKKDQFTHIEVTHLNQLWFKLEQSHQKFNHIVLMAHHSPNMEGIAYFGNAMFDSGFLRKWPQDRYENLDPNEVTFVRYSCYGLCTPQDVKDTDVFVEDLATNGNRRISMISSPRQVIGRKDVVALIPWWLGVNPIVSGSTLAIEKMVHSFNDSQTYQYVRAFDPSVKLVETTATAESPPKSRILLKNPSP